MQLHRYPEHAHGTFRVRLHDALDTMTEGRSSTNVTAQLGIVELPAVEITAEEEPLIRIRPGDSTPLREMDTLARHGHPSPLSLFGFLPNSLIHSRLPATAERAFT
jgi:hypothetical protein